MRLKAVPLLFLIRITVPKKDLFERVTTRILNVAKICRRSMQRRVSYALNDEGDFKIRFLDSLQLIVSHRHQHLILIVRSTDQF